MIRETRYGSRAIRFRLAQEDIQRAYAVATIARCCLTVANATSFHELAKLPNGELRAQTSYSFRARVPGCAACPGQSNSGTSATATKPASRSCASCGRSRVGPSNRFK